VHVCWTVESAGTIGRTNLDGTGVEERSISAAAYYPGLAVDANV
jgi:hypothetical protein